jgi:ethanolamine ammonia-lyase small subunit
VTSNASDRSEYLRRPDLGRTLSPASNQLLQQLTPAAQPELVFVIADGLCSNAIHHHAVQVLVAFKDLNASCGVAPIIIATQARVAIGDEIGALLGAKAVAVLIGERPGLSSSDSLGIYLTWRPRPGLTDADRNCISNIHVQGLDPGVAAQKLAALLDGARLLGGTGTQLHDKLDESALEQQIKRALGS